MKKPLNSTRGILARFFGRATPAQKNRAFRSKSSEAHKRFLWAFRYNPSRERQLRNRIYREVEKVK
jgi:hypothetical protein